MNYAALAKAIVDDLGRVARSGPNERLPKEEQIRSRVFAELLAESEVVCVERGYASVEEKSPVEVDIWAKSSVGETIWLELKRCWNAAEWVNKPKEQLKSWNDDIQKLGEAPKNDVRVFMLVGRWPVRCRSIE